MPNSLDTYNSKRDFALTAEPAGKIAAAAGHVFMVQKHDATRLHWDFRLELDGVLKSWAVTRGPSLDPADKRLSVRTEDHPLSYATFEGTIPKGEYGGGTVMLWDRGIWEPLAGKDPRKTILEGHLHFTLHGERMKGEWIMIRLKPRGREKHENWLLRKVADEFAGTSGELVDLALTSVATGRTMVEIAEGKRPKALKKAKVVKPSSPSPSPKGRGSIRTKSAPPPDPRPFQLATLVDRVPAGPGWLHEVKYDGYRLLLAVGGGKAIAWTRNGKDWSDRFGSIVSAAAALPGTALIDGEVVVLDAKGRPSFSALQASLKDGSGKLAFFAFDLLERDGEDLSPLPNVERKALLAALLEGISAPLHYAEHITGSGEDLFGVLCRDGYEGVVSKRADAPYVGKRSSAWLKAKCTRRQEFVIVGWLPSDKSGRGFRSLLLGLHEDGALRYAGKAGTGFDGDMIDRLMRLMKPLERKTPTVEAPRAAVRGAHWVAPKLVAEVAFTEFTEDGVLRHPSFLGLREDKPAADVVKERPAAAPAAKAAKSAIADHHGVKISSEDRVIFPESGLTKGALADYYTAVAGIMLRDMADRPVSLVRCPQGRAKQCFFQKHDAGSFGDVVGHIDILEKDGSHEPYLVVGNPKALLACVQMGTIEFHGWGAPASDYEHPDRMVFDLEPDEGLDFADVKRAAVQIKVLLGELGLVTFPMLSGGKGVHVVVPLDRSADWPKVKDFASRFAKALGQAHPDRFTANMKKADRTGRIFLDWLRNQRGATAVMPYSARSRANAPVAAPVTWDELETIDSPAHYTIGDAGALIARAGSAELVEWGTASQALPDY